MISSNDGQPSAECGTSSVVLRVGVLGCADIARRKMLPALVAEPAVELVAVASRTEERARSFAAAFGCKPIASYDALLARQDIDAVYVPLPPGLHAEWVRAALEAGKHVLVEKPAVTCVADAESLVRLAERRGLALMESFMTLHHGQHTAVAELVRAGTIGRLVSFTCDFGIPPRPPGDIRLEPALGGGALHDAGVHPLRLARFFLGPSLEVVGATSIVDGVDVAGAVLLRNADGVTAHLTYGYRHAYRSMYALWGDAGRIELHRVVAPAPNWRPVVRIERPDVVEERTLPAADQFRNIVRAFAAEARSPGRSVELLCQAELVAAVAQRLPTH